MAKRMFSTVLNHGNDAGFRAWATELHAEIVASGLIQTADVGQLSTPVSASRASATAATGYWVFRFADALSGSAPVYLKIEVGSASGTAIPGIWATVGTGSDGIGGITGVVVPRTYMVVSASSVTSTTTPFPSYINHDEGFFGLCWKAGSVAIARGYIFICRTVDDAGNPTAEGYAVFLKSPGGTAASEAHFGAWIGYSAVDGGKNWTSIPAALTDTAVGADYQAFKVYGAYPAVRVVPQLVVTVKAELPAGALTGPIEVMDGVFRNFIGLGEGAGSATVTHASNYAFAMKWD